MNPVEVFARRPVLSTMFTMFLVVLGYFSYQRLGVDLMADVELPVVTVTTTLRGVSPEEMETAITRPVEEILNTIEGIDEMRSTTTEGRSVVTVNFKLERNRDAATQDVRDKVNTILNRLPEGTDPPVITRFDLDASPVLTIVVSGPQSRKELTEIARRRLKEAVESRQGVGSVELLGGETRAIFVNVDPFAMDARSITVEDVRRSLMTENQEVPGGRVLNLALAFLLSLIFMYMIPAAQFESFVHPISILLALPLAMPFALLSLMALGETLNIYSIFGLFMLAGVIKKNGILQIDYTIQLRNRGLSRHEAILESNKARLRPILMTTLTLIAGMIPIALGEGPGAANRAAMAKVIIGGQALSLLVTRLITPVAYALFDDLANVLTRRGSFRKAADA